MIKDALYFLQFLAYAYLALCAFLFFSQRSLIYHPRPHRDAAVQAMTIRSEEEELIVSVRDTKSPHAVLYFGGNAEDVSRSLPMLAWAFPNATIYAPHYRGYGGSSGSASEAGLILDAQIVYETVRPNHSHIIVVGRSLGTGVAVRLASARPVERLVLITPFSSLIDVAAKHYPFIPARWLLRDKYESWRFAPMVTAPTTIIAAGRDEIIPLSSTQRLLEAFAPNVATLSILPEVDHNNVDAAPGFMTALAGG